MPPSRITTHPSEVLLTWSALEVLLTWPALAGRPTPPCNVRRGTMHHRGGSPRRLYCCGRTQPEARFWSETCRNVQKCTFLHVSDRQNRQSPSPLLLWSDAAGGTFLTCFGGRGGTPPGHSWK
jgi:hypothetical protein